MREKLPVAPGVRYESRCAGSGAGPAVRQAQLGLKAEEKGF